MSEALSLIERSELAECEAVIERNLTVFYETGYALLKIRNDRLYRATHGTFEEYCRERWGISRVHAHRLIEASSVAENLLPIGNIPATESQARELVRLEPDEQREAWRKAVDTAPNGVVTAAYIREVVNERAIMNAAREIRNEQIEARRQERIAKIAGIASATIEPLSGLGRYPLILADPPWRYDFTKADRDRIENHYPTMSLEEICALPVADVAADSCVLFLWTTAPKLMEAGKVVEAWGFEYRTGSVWDKAWIGLGHYFRTRHEHLLIATRGSIPTPADDARPDSIFTERRTAHSKKPELAYQLIERMYPELPKLELFARSPREGWSAWGYEAAAKAAA